MNKYLAELIGTFCLVFAGTGAIVIDSATDGTVTHVGIALTFGLVVMAVIYAIGDTSGAHINPAVTLGFWAARRLPGKEVPRYMAAQCIGGCAGSALLLFLFPASETYGATAPAGAITQSFVLEIAITFMLMFVILSVAIGPKERGLMAGIAVGGVVGLAAMFAGPISGASMNPARSLGPAVVSGEFGVLWVYLLAPAVGSLIAVPLWLLTRNREE